jgi:hypothetical protein
MDPAATDARYERKYHLADGRHGDFVNHLLGSGFSRQHPDRVVNSVYFDGRDRAAFFEKIDGVSERTKYRVRWYGEGGAERSISAKLEVKKRRNEVGTKLNAPLPVAEGEAALFTYLSTSEMGRELERFGQFDLRPVVWIRYLRRYFRHRDADIRATVDRRLVGSEFRQAGAKARADFRGLGACVMEIKYGLDLDELVRSSLLGSRFPFRLHKYSKFSMACGALQH